MLKLNRFVFGCVLLMIAGCPSLFDSSNNLEIPADAELVWVNKDFSGGRQCDPDDSYRPPDTKRMLEKQGIAVAETKVEHFGVCAACSCPAYAARHFALIPVQYLDKARQLGFERAE